MSGEAKNVRYHKSSEESASPGAAPAEPSESVPEAEASSRKPRNHFLTLPDSGLKLILSMLHGRDVVRLDTAMSHKECRAALLEAYNGTKVYGFSFLYDLPSIQKENPNELCEGLQWTEQRDIIATDYSLDIPTEEHANHFQHLVKMSRTRMARMLIQRCPHSYQWNYPGTYTPLMICCARHEIALIKELLLAPHVDVNGKSAKNEYTALHWLTRGDSDEYLYEIQLLLACSRINVNMRGGKGRAPLHLAVRNGNLEEAKLLLSHGAEANLLDDEGETALDAAYYSYSPYFEGMVELLRAKGGKLGSEL